MEIRYLQFSGTKEEFDSVIPLLESSERTVSSVVGQEGPSSYGDSGDSLPEALDYKLTVEDALKVMRYGNGMSPGQIEIFKLLYEKDREVPSSEFKSTYGWSAARFRGVLANLPKRENGALGHRVPLVRFRWDGLQAYYTLDPAAREAFEIEYAST